VRIIGLTGCARSGKDTVASLIKEYRAGTVLFSFARPMKEFCKMLFGFTHEQLDGDEREVPDSRWTRPDGTPLTARFALQTLGTEWGRNCDSDLWVKACLNTMDRSRANIAVVTDVRFLNEAAALRKAGAELWRVRRAKVNGVGHQSEQFVWSQGMTEHVTREIDNTGTLNDLRHIVAQASRPQ
jgi:hypothetical protein